MQRLSLLLLCAAVSIAAYVVLGQWHARNAPLHQRFERIWKEDVALLEQSGKLPRGWSEIGEIELFGGTPESKSWLRQIQTPVAVKSANGGYKLEILVVAWEEDGVRGALVQYNLVNKNTGNMIWELGRTLILSRPEDSPLKL